MTKWKEQFSQKKDYINQTKQIKLKDGIYIGETKWGIPDGYGIMFFYGNDVYEGGFKNGK